MACNLLMVHHQYSTHCIEHCWIRKPLSWYQGDTVLIRFKQVFYIFFQTGLNFRRGRKCKFLTIERLHWLDEKRDLDEKEDQQNTGQQRLTRQVDRRRLCRRQGIPLRRDRTASLSRSRRVVYRGWPQLQIRNGSNLQLVHDFHYPNLAWPTLTFNRIIWESLMTNRLMVGLFTAIVISIRMRVWTLIVS